MGAGQSSEKKSPTKDVKETQETEKSSPRKTSTSSTSSAKDAKTPTKVPEVTVSGDSSSPSATKPLDLEVSEEEVASVEAAAKKMRDTVGGTSIEIVLSPAVKKVIVLKTNFLTNS